MINLCYIIYRIEGMYMGIFGKHKLKKNRDAVEKLVCFSIYDILIYSICFAIMLIIISMGLRSWLNINNTNIITNYQSAVSYTVDSNIYISILSILINISVLLVFLFTVGNAFRRRLLNKEDYRQYIVFIVVSILVLSTVAWVGTVALAYDRLLCIDKACQVTDFSFYSYELDALNKLYAGVAINYYVWTLLAIFLSVVFIKYLYNKKIIIKEVGSNGIIQRIVKKKR